MSIDAKELLDLISPDEIIEYIKCNGYPIDTSFYYDADYLMSVGVNPGGTVTYAEGLEVKHVLKADSIGKAVLFGWGLESGKWTYPKSFWIYSDGKPVCGWGEKPEVEG